MAISKVLSGANTPPPLAQPIYHMIDGFGNHIVVTPKVDNSVTITAADGVSAPVLSREHVRDLQPFLNQLLTGIRP